jgi:ribonuclease HI
MIILYTDGASRGNPGPAAIGVIAIREPGERLFTLSEKIGISSNNEAEYQALLKGLLYLVELGLTSEPICIRVDSELIARQLSGEYRVKSSHLRPYYEKVREVFRHFPEVRIEHIPRQKNQIADQLANSAFSSKERSER